MRRVRFLLGLLTLVSALFGVRTDAQPQVSNNRARGTGVEVNVTRVVRVRLAEDITAYSIVFRYAFSGRQTVDLGPLGTVPAEGGFSFLTTERELVFRETSGGAILARVPLQETVQAAARPPLIKIPDESQFPPGHITISWPAQASFQDRANTVLARHFRYVPRTIDGETKYFTTFATLPNRTFPRGTLGRVALLISLPAAPRTDPFQVRVRSLVLEGKTHSDELREPSNEEVTTEAARFVNALVSQLQGENRP